MNKKDNRIGTNSNLESSQSIDKSEIENTIRIGIAKGKLSVPDDIDKCNEEIADMFNKELI